MAAVDDLYYGMLKNGTNGYNNNLLNFKPGGITDATIGGNFYDGIGGIGSGNNTASNSSFNFDNLAKKIGGGVVSDGKGGMIYDPGYSNVLKGIGSGLSWWENKKNNQKNQELMEQQLNMMEDFGLADAGMKLNNLYTARNRWNKMGDYLGGINEGRTDLNQLRQEGSLKYDNQNGIVDPNTGQVSTLPGAEGVAARFNTPAPATPTVSSPQPQTTNVGGSAFAQTAKPVTQAVKKPVKKLT